jgi:hypothetical protein
MLQAAERDGTRVMWTAESSKRRRRPSTGLERAWGKVTHSSSPALGTCTECMASLQTDGRYSISISSVLCSAARDLCNVASSEASFLASSDIAAHCVH